ncbi:MAG: aminotransferase class V-fold PLP-dependent enzyme [Anaerolineae bacterium]|nr:aminotransferase class V-fold PLP-dependent enzyme [Thermoflexales bacterium]MDW8408478.1 aminotransferase class V-fold PLP-dependent enzyme [Anaerolineae bacterium]
MSIYDELGVRRIINANATLTRLGGSIMPPEVLAAMQEAADWFVDLDELHMRVGEKLAELTHNEAAYVATGAAAGIVLAVAACAARGDRERMMRLPDTSGMKNEALVFKSHRNGYDHAIRNAGLKIVEIGDGTVCTPAELEAAINDRTAVLVWFQGAMTGRGDLPLAQVIEICAIQGVPVIVDAAAQLPPLENLWQFTQMGAACAIFSGGKDLRGPQSTGLVVGKKWLIEAMRPLGNPNQGLGRPMKVGKEEMVGLLAAVKRYMSLDHAARRARDERIVAEWCRALNTRPGVCARRSFPNEAGQPLPRCEVILDDTARLTREALMAALMAGEPAISVAAADERGIFLNPMTLSDEEVGIVQARLLELL